MISDQKSEVPHEKEETGERGRLRVAETTPVPTLHSFFAPIPPPYDKESYSSSTADTSTDLLPYGA